MIDQLPLLEVDEVQEKIISLKQKQAEINHQFARSQMECAEIMLDITSTIRDDATKKRCLEKARRIKERVGTHLSRQAGLSSSELHALQMALAKLEVRFIATGALLAIGYSEKRV